MEQPDEKKHIKQSMGKGLWVSTSSSEGTSIPRSPGIHTPGSSLSPTQLWFYGGLTTQVGEGDGTPLQYSRLENPMNGGAW